MSERWQLTALLLLALALRLSWVLHLPTDPATIDRLPDQREYLQLGRNVLHRQGLSFVDPRFDQTVYAYRTPGYPLFVAACGSNVAVVRVAQAVLDTVTVLAVYLLARRLKCPLPIVAGLLVALNPFLIYFSGLVLSETLFTSLLTWAMVAASGLTVSSRILPPLWRAGCLLAIGVLVRPSAVLLAPVLAIAGAWMNWEGPRAYRSLVLGLLVSAAPTVLLLSLWGYRNHRQLGEWVWTTTNSGITSYDGFNPSATGASDQSFVATMPELRSIGEVQRSRYLGGLARRYALEHPGRSVELATAKVMRTWSPVPLSKEYGGRAYWWVGLMYSVPVDVLVILGLCCWTARGRTKVLLVIPAIYFTAVHAMSVGSLRYRVPVEPVLAVVAGGGAGVALRKRSRETGEGSIG